MDRARLRPVHRARRRGARRRSFWGRYAHEQTSAFAASSCWLLRARRRAQPRARRRRPPSRPLQLGRAAAGGARRRSAARASCSCRPRRPSCALRNIEAERLPSISALEGQAQYQSDVPTRAGHAAGGQPLFSPPKGHLRRVVCASISACSIRRSGRGSRSSAPQLAESQARVRATLFALRQEVNDAFFAAALLQERPARSRRRSPISRRACARRRRACARARRCRATPPRSKRRSSSAGRTRPSSARTARAALARLATLTGRAIRTPTRLDAAGTARPPSRRRAARWTRCARGPSTNSSPRARPRRRASRSGDGRAGASAACRRSAASATASPGLNFISDQFESYALAGVQLQWKAGPGARAGREREALAIQQQIVAADEAAFTESLRRGDRGAIWRRSIACRRRWRLDERIIALREQVERATRGALSGRRRDGLGVSRSQHGTARGAQFARAAAPRGAGAGARARS